MTDGLVAALARCQAKFPAIVKSHTNPAFKGSQYADIADVLAAVRPVLAAEGIALTQVTNDNDDGVVLITTLHMGEEMLGSRFPLNIDNLSAQQVGSLMTYMRRYQLCALLGVHPVGDDDDGNAAQTAPARPQARSITATTEDGRRFSVETGNASVDPYALAAASPPEKPIAAMTMAELIAYGRTIGVVMSGSKSDFVRTLEPYVLAATGAEPWDTAPVEGEGAHPGNPGRLDAVNPPAPSRPEPDAIPFEPVVAKPTAERLLPPDARKSVRSQ